MPLHPGKLKKIISDNISELIRSSKDKGGIGNINTKNKSSQEVNRIAAAIALNKVGKRKRRRKKK